MSGSSRRRQSKWDHRDPETISENLLEKDPPRKPREPPSPSRGSHRHESHRREKTITSDREEHDIRTSPGLDEWRHQRRSRSPRNGWGRSYRSRSRSRSRSPAYSSRREPALTEKSRGKICRDFTSGRCRRGNHCLFLHQDAEHYDSRRSLGSSLPDNWESRDRRTGGSRYSADDNKDYSVRSERSVNLCNDFMKGRCRRGSSCRYAHHEGPAADGFERGPADDVYRDRDNDRRIKDTYPDRNHDRETFKRGETLCKFFAAGNCRNGNRCKFSHQVQESFSPERRSQDDRRGSDRKFDGSPACDEPRWSDAVRVSNVHGWGEDKEITGVNAVSFGDDSWSHDVVKLKQTWDAPSGVDEPKIGDERQSLQWKTENSGVPTGLTASVGVENFSGDMEISPRDVSKQNSSSLYSQTPSLSNVSFPAVQQDTASETTHDKHYQYGFSEPKAFNDPFAGQNPKFEDKPNIYASEGRNNVSSDRVSITPNPLMNVRPVQGVFPNDPRVNVRPISSINPPGQNQLQPPLRPSGGDTMQLSTPNPPMNAPLGQGISHSDQGVNFQLTTSINPPAGQGQLSLPLHPSGGNGMQTSHNLSSFLDTKAAAGPPSDPRVSFRPMSSINPPPAGQGQLSFPTHPPGGNGMQTLHNPSSFLDNKVDDGPHLGNANVSTSVTNQSSVSNEQLVQLSHLSASLAQLLENRQQLHLSSAVNPSGMSSPPEPAASIPPVSNATLQPNQSPEPVKQYDPLCDSIERKMPNLGNQMLPSNVEQKSSDNELHPESVDVNQQEPHTVSKDDENGGKIAEGGSKAPENRPSENMAVDDGIDDGKKSKDSKGIRTFKFALADFVKELLKPTWKDGQVSKEAYKTIVKKVVDKVIETQGPQIPQTKEKIDQYLSCSKPKLDKLVQAYVGKYQKS